MSAAGGRAAELANRATTTGHAVQSQALGTAAIAFAILHLAEVIKATDHTPTMQEWDSVQGR